MHARKVREVKNRNAVLTSLDVSSSLQFNANYELASSSLAQCIALGLYCAIITPRGGVGPGRRGIEERSAAGPIDADTTAMDDPGALAPDDRVVTSNLTLHQLFEQQTARMLERADLNEEQQQSLLIGMSCPCCGAGGFSFTAKLRRSG